MENFKLRRQYRELDRDCARLSYELSGGEEGARKLFIPDKNNMARVRNTWKELKERAEALEEPNAVFSLLKHHFEDFLDSLEYTIENAEKHPENCFVQMHWMIENISRLSRKSDEKRCRELVRRLEEACEAEDVFLGLIQAQNVGKFQGSASGTDRYRNCQVKAWRIFSDIYERAVQDCRRVDDTV